MPTHMLTHFSTLLLALLQRIIFRAIPIVRPIYRRNATTHAPLLRADASMQ
jgi:hypothetical protein